MYLSRKKDVRNWGCAGRSLSYNSSITEADMKMALGAFKEKIEQYAEAYIYQEIAGFYRY